MCVQGKAIRAVTRGPQALDACAWQRHPGLMTQPKAPPAQEVYTLLVQVGRKPGDGLPEGATGAGLLCYCAARDEAEAVRETVAVLKQADLAPLDVTAYGTQAERLAQGHEIGADDAELMARAKAENAVIVAQMTPFFDNETIADDD